MRRSQRRGSRVGARTIALAVIVSMSMVGALLQSPADAQEPPPDQIVIDLQPFTPLQPASITMQPLTGQIISIQGVESAWVPGQCIHLAGSDQVCLGNPGPVKVEGEATTDRLLIRPDAHDALGWIVEEAVQVVAAQYNVPADDRVEQYARDEVRAHMATRILEIIDRAAYGEPLTAEEQRALRFVQNELLVADQTIARAAYGEFARFTNERCAYVPPPAPAFVRDPVPVPGSVASGCRGAIGVGSVFSPPIPKVEEFQAWGFYRVAEQLGLNALNHPAVQANVTGLIRAGVLGAGLVVAAGAAAATFAAVGASAALAKSITLLLASGSMSAFYGGSFAVAFGAAAAAGIVLIVILALVALGLSIWQLVETEQVGNTLSARMAAANATTDPFGLEALQEANEGRDLEEDRETWVDEASKPLHRREKSVTRLSEYIARWTMVRSSGSVRLDPTGVWPDNATTGADYRFRVTDSGGNVTFRNEISVQTEGGGTATARFNDGWLVVTPSGGSPQAQLQLEHLNEAGELAYATRQPVPDGDGDQRFTVTTPLAGGGSTSQTSITYRVPGGGVETAQIVAPLDEAAVAARPTVTGSFLPERTHRLRPNAINAEGQVDDAAFIDDYDAEWTLERYDEATGSWVADTPVTADPVGANPTYGAMFTPTRAGRYRAQATLVHRDGAAPDAVGSVEFSVNPPPIDIIQLNADDDHLGGELEVRVQAIEPVETDEITVEVTWPGTLGSDAPGPTTQTTITCSSGPPCATPVTTLTQPTDVFTDLRDDVTVTLTNSHGGKITRIVPISAPARPSFSAPPVAPGPDQPGVVSFDDYITHVQLPAGVGGDPNYVVAGVTPGGGEADPTFMITDPNNPGPPLVALDVRGDGTFLISIDEHEGEPVVVLRGVPRMEDIGTYEVPILVQQSNGARRTLVVLIDVVPAANDRFRAGLFSEVDPLNFVEDGPPAAEVRMLGGKDEWGPYEGDLCVGLATAFTDAQHCADASEFFESDGTPRPFPYHKLAPHGLEAGTGVIRIRAWLPEGERTYAEPSEVSFILQAGTTPPRIDALTWDGSTASATLAVTPGSAPVSTVTCSLAGEPLPTCFAPTGGTWSPPPLPPGEHDVDVLVVDALGNFDTGVVTVSVPDPQADALSVVIAGAYTYAVSGAASSGDVDVVEDALGVTRVRGRVQVGSADVTIDVSRLWVFRVYIGSVVVVDPAAGLPRVWAPVVVAGLAATGDPVTVSSSASWFAIRERLQIQRYTIQWSVTDNG